LSLLLGCSSTRSLKARVTDEEGRPIAGAIVYMEAWKHPEAYDFCFGVTDSNGMVPSQGTAPPMLQWRSGARAAWAVFAEGKEPVAVISYRLEESPGTLDIQLKAWTKPGTGSSSRLTKLGFPFPDQPELAARVTAPDAAPLRQAFWRAYGQIANQFLPADRPKYDALKRMMEPPFQGAP
jgi:hypothetical protein